MVYANFENMSSKTLCSGDSGVPADMKAFVRGEIAASFANMSVVLGG